MEEEKEPSGAGEKAPGPGAAMGPAGKVPAEPERLHSLQWAMWLGMVGAAAAGLFNLVAFLQVGAWQMLVELAATVASIALVAVGLRFSSRGRMVAARNMLLVGMLLAFGAGELVHTGLTLYLTAGGMALILLVGIVLVPSKWWPWLLVTAGYGAYMAVVNWLQPLPRFDLRQLGIQADAFVYALVGFLVVACLYVVARFYQRLMAIRVRLPVSFVLVVLGSVVIVATAGAVVGSQGGRRQSVKQLQSVAAMKGAELDQWIGRVEAALDEALAEGGVEPRMVLLLQTLDWAETESLYPDSYLQYVAQESEYFDDFALLDLDGKVRMFTAMASDRPQQVRAADLLQSLLAFHLQPPLRTAASDQARLVAMRPVVDRSGRSLGVLVGMVKTSSLSELLGERAWLGDTGEMYLIDGNRYALTDLRFSPQPQILLDTELETLGVERQADVSMTYTDYRGQQVVGVLHWLPQLGLMLVAKQDVAESAAVTNQFMLVIALVAAGEFLVAVVVSLLMTRSITEPLAELTETADRIARGDLSLVPQRAARDEIGLLSRAFGSMTAQLRDMIDSLEGRVAERTRELERRSAYLEASAEVGRAASSILDPDELMRDVVELIRDRFGLYYVGLFVLDPSRQWAVLRAGTGRAGDLMLKRGHRIEVGKGVVGWSVAHAQSRVAEEAAGDEVRLATPELPDTRSEAALPLRSRGQILGAITVQDTRPAAFDANTLAVLQTMADQVAVAIDNAHLFEQSQRALEAQQQAYGEISRQAWLGMIEAAAVKGYRCDSVSVVPASGDLPSLSRQALAERRLVATSPASHPGRANTRRGDGGGAGSEAGNGQLSGTGGEGEGASRVPRDTRGEMAVPVTVRDQVIGVLHFRKEEADHIPWSREQTALVEGLAEQLGQALESARLYRDSQLRAGRERLAAEVTARMRESLDVETVLQTAAREMQEVFNLAEVELRIHSGADYPASPLAERGPEYRPGQTGVRGD